jgi:hypothetical protein
MFDFLKTVITKKNSLYSNNSLNYLKQILKFNANDNLDPLKEPFKYFGIYGNSIKFESKEKSLIKFVPLKTIKLEEKDNFGYYVWYASYDEYKQVYFNDFEIFLKNDLTNIYNILIENKNNQDYKYVLVKYEMTFLTILNTLNDSIQINGIITKDISTPILELLKQFHKALKEQVNNKIELNNLEKEAMNENLKNRLSFEIEYQKRYL